MQSSSTRRFLDQPIDWRSRLMLVVAAGLLVTIYFVPLWNMTMFAPQYRDGLRLDIYAYTLTGGNNGQDVREINVLNHYIGMHELADTSFAELQWMPFVIGALGLLVLRAAVHATVASVMDVTMLFVYFGAFSLWSFGYKLYQYGHDLAPDAAVKVPPFMPPMFGYRQIANFEVYSYPRAGTYAMLGVMLLLAGALVSTWWQSRHTPEVPAPAG
ncbi:MAG: hypothetical protein IT180_07800 [Acidobacteria bacterium]|nr:hypothetical protein [Acidobacteriota bacterium]